MPYRVDTEIPLQLNNNRNCNYIISSHHRGNGNDHKSIWSLSHVEEIECFSIAINEKWYENTNAWGIKIENEALQVVGHNSARESLKLSKFIDASNNKLWHGYPADYLRKSQDRPPTFILVNWVGKGYITKSKMNKIRKGLPCNL